MSNPILSDSEQDSILDALEGWELVEFLQVPIEDILEIAIENEWINDETVEDVLELAGVKK